jgi:hypothetical protein
MLSIRKLSLSIKRLGGDGAASLMTKKQEAEEGM